MDFRADCARRTFTFTFTTRGRGADEPGPSQGRGAASGRHVTEIFVPQYQYPDGVEVVVSDGEWELDAAMQTLFYRHSDMVEEHTVTLRLPSG